MIKNYYKAKFNGIALMDLVATAYQRLHQNLERFGNTLSPKHSQALHEILEGFTLMAQGRMWGRFAYPLFTGGAKTQSIVAWLYAVNELGHDHVSVAVCASKVEALCDLKRDLIKNGVPEDKIGLLHSYRYDLETAEAYLNDDDELPPNYASEPCTDENQEKPILLCTHNRVKGKSETKQFNEYLGKSRTLLIWDESLIQSESRGVREDLLLSGLGWLKPFLRNPTLVAQEAISYVENAIQTIRTEKEAQREEEREPKIINLPYLSTRQIEAFKKVFTRGRRDILEPIRELLDICRYDLRVIDTGHQSPGFLKYEITVPPELKNIIILDASHNIRKLCQMDASIQKASRHSDNIVSYRNVHVRQIKHPAGRGAITGAIKKKNSPLIKEYVDIIKQIPETEGIIIFYFKPKYDGHRLVDGKKILRKALKEAGIDTKATVKAPVWRDLNGVGQWTTVDKPRFNWITHGNETSLSKYSYCKNELWIGVLHRGSLEIASRIAGQADDLLMDIPSSLVHDTIQSEVCYCYHQGFARSACRIINDGVAQPANIWITYKGHYDVEGILKAELRDIKWATWATTCIDTLNNAETIAHKVTKYLSQLASKYSESDSTEQLKISVAELKKTLGIGTTDAERETFSRATKLILSELKGWVKQGRSFVLKDASWYGFTQN